MEGRIDSGRRPEKASQVGNAGLERFPDLQLCRRRYLGCSSHVETRQARGTGNETSHELGEVTPLPKVDTCHGSEPSLGGLGLERGPASERFCTLELARRRVLVPTMQGLHAHELAACCFEGHARSGPRQHGVRQRCGIGNAAIGIDERALGCVLHGGHFDPRPSDLGRRQRDRADSLILGGRLAGRSHR